LFGQTLGGLIEARGREGERLGELIVQRLEGMREQVQNLGCFTPNVAFLPIWQSVTEIAVGSALTHE